MKYSIMAVIFGLLYLPFTLYLTYLMLVKIEADNLMWFLFWLTIPLAIVFTILGKLADWEEKD